MFKSMLYMNVFLLTVMSAVYLFKSFSAKADLKKLIFLMFIYLFYELFNAYLCESGIVDVGWDFIGLRLAYFSALVLYIIGIIHTIIKAVKSKKSGSSDVRHLSLIKCIALIIFPIPVLIIPYKYELDILDNSDYLLKYNYQRGIISSEDTYIAIANDKPLEVTLIKKLKDKNGTDIEYQKYDAVFGDDVEISIRDRLYNKIIIEDEEIKKILLGAKEKRPEAEKAYMEHFSEKGYSVITVSETSGTVLGEYFYNGTSYIELHTLGDLSEVVRYR